MADDRYRRWQGLAIAQLSVAVALISGLSVAGLGAGLSLLQNDKFLLSPPYTRIFLLSLALLLFAALFSCGAVITRLLDFRLTARKVRAKQRHDYKKYLTMFGLGSEAYSCLTWALFWPSVCSFTIGIVLLVLSVGVAYSGRWH